MVIGRYLLPFVFATLLFGCSSAKGGVQTKRAASQSSSSVPKVIKKQTQPNNHTNRSIMYSLEQITAKSGDRPPVQITISISLGLRADHSSLLDELKSRQNHLRIVISRIINKITIQQVNTSRKREFFKRYILQAVNGVLMQGLVEKIYFKAFVIK